MKKYITLAALLVAGTAFANADSFTCHDVEFTSISSNPTQNWANATASNYVLSSSAYGNRLEYCGLALLEGAGIKTNNGGSDLSATYLYLDESITFGTSTDVKSNELTWSSINDNTSINIADNGWADINADYGERISLSNMTSGGSVYLNETGALSLVNNSVAYVLDKDVSVYATFTNKNRTLLSGDFTSWTAEDVAKQVFVTGLTGDFKVVANNTGLHIIPEPSAFGLLAGLGALALVGTRRRRK